VTAPFPPVAAHWPVVGNLPAYMQDPLRFLLTTRERYGDIVRVSLGPMQATLLSHPDMVEDVLVTRNKLWRKDRFLQTTLRPVLGQGLLTSEGDFGDDSGVSRSRHFIAIASPPTPASWSTMRWVWPRAGTSVRHATYTKT